MKVAIVGQSSVGKTVFYKICLNNMDTYKDTPTTNGEFAVNFDIWIRYLFLTIISINFRILT